jgi:hypothetical protein
MVNAMARVDQLPVRVVLPLINIRSLVMLSYVLIAERQQHLFGAEMNRAIQFVMRVGYIINSIMCIDQ